MQNASSAAAQVEASQFSQRSQYVSGWDFFFGAAGRGLGPFKLEHLQASLSSHHIYQQLYMRNEKQAGDYQFFFFPWLPRGKKEITNEK